MRGCASSVGMLLLVLTLIHGCVITLLASTTALTPQPPPNQTACVPAPCHSATVHW